MSCRVVDQAMMAGEQGGRWTEWNNLHQDNALMEMEEAHVRPARPSWWPRLCFRLSARPRWPGRTRLRSKPAPPTPRPVRIVFEEIRKGRIDENEHIYHPDSWSTADAGLQPGGGPRVRRAGGRPPDMAVSVLQTVAACDTVAVHYEVSGTTRAKATPACHRPPFYRARHIVSGLRDGLIAEEWMKVRPVRMPAAILFPS